MNEDYSNPFWSSPARQDRKKIWRWIAVVFACAVVMAIASRFI